MLAIAFGEASNYWKLMPIVLHGGAILVLGRGTVHGVLHDTIRVAVRDTVHVAVVVEVDGYPVSPARNHLSE